ncbi:uncharacterized protein LOC125823536 [Solanum verrucosum]|uniref:uncharacterized protein LOC125823536 n=1 Tax=Solanum verrucosum TaxID=315347 RepID=UPI0020D1153E|nr:uncharacterized protein LOC125823536 [Solanum verrucosum]
MEGPSNKKWMYCDRVSKEYLDGVNDFLNHAFSQKQNGDKIACPCTECVLFHQVNRATAYDHLVVNGILSSYDTWFCHGESLKKSNNTQVTNCSQSTVRGDDVTGIIHDAFGGCTQLMDSDVNESSEVEPNLTENSACTSGNQTHQEMDKFEQLMKEANEELYPGCKKFSKLSFLLHIYRTKCMFKWSNESFDSLLGLLKDVLPEGEKLPPSFYETKNIVEGLGLKYEKIHACPNDCMLFRKEFASNDVNECKICGASRWKNNAKKIPAKVLRYSEFARDPRNVRLGLSSDGFNPFGTMQTVHSTWPVILMPYNLPPWMCMKEEFSILSLLILGPKSPGNNIDVFLQPLIEELNELWSVGVETYDASTKETFQMRAALMWTINDFPAYGTLSGWSTYGPFACPSCNINTHFKRLNHGRKFCFIGHRRFLKSSHKYRNDAKSFDGTKETRHAPCAISASQVLDQVKDIKFTLGQSSEEKAEAYIANECLAFYSRYLEGGDSRSYYSRKCDDEIEHETSKEECLFPFTGESYGAVDVYEMDEKTLFQAHRHVLVNCESEVVENYKKLNEIVELNYYEEFKVVLFKCNWVDVTKGRGIMEDDLGFTVVNFSRLADSGDRKRHEPFIFAEQAQQVIFVQDPQDCEWFVPRLIKPRDVFDMGEENSVQIES